MGSEESVPRNYLDRLSPEDEEGEMMRSGLCNADPVTKQGKRIQLAQMLVLPLVPLVFLLVECSISLNNTLIQTKKDELVRKEVETMMDLAILIDITQRERTQALHYLTTDRQHPDQFLDTIQNTVRTLATLKGWPVSQGNTDSTSLVYSKSVFTSALNDWRSGIWENESETNQASSSARIRDQLFDETLRFCNKIDAQLFKSFVLKLRQVTGKVWKHLMPLKSVLQLRESFDVEMVLAEYYFVHGYLVQGHYQMFLKHFALGKDSGATLRLHSDTAERAFDAFVKDHADIIEYIKEKQMMVMQLSLNGQKNPDVAKEWIKKTEEHEKLTIELWHKLEDESRQDMEDRRITSIIDESMAIVVVCFVIGLSPALLSSTWRLVSKIQQYALNLTRNARERRREKKRSDMLLYQMLPKSVALQLKLSRRVAAESYNSVSIYFSDIVGFTQLGSRSTPMQVVDFLNKLYYFFDDILSQYDVYKVETIGDAYMVTSGVPQRNGKRHAGEVGSMSLEMVEGLRAFRIPHMPLEQLRIRIGIHTGPVVAGVVGSKMPRYCLFGESVTMASCMESTGSPMKIQLSAATKNALDELGGYIIEKRGTVEIKGIKYETWLLIGRQNSRAASHISSNILGSARSADVRSHVNIFTATEINLSPPQQDDAQGCSADK